MKRKHVVFTVLLLSLSLISNSQDWDWYKHFADMSPMRENITTDDVGNAAVFLASDLSSRITGDVLYVDSGFNIVGVQMGPKE